MKDYLNTTTSTVGVCCACGGIMELCNEPKIVYSIKIPFTRYTIDIIDYDYEEYVCMECYNEKKQEPHREAFEAGQESGYYRRGNHDHKRNY